MITLQLLFRNLAVAADQDTEVEHHAESVRRKFLRLLALLGTVSPYVPHESQRNMLRGPAHFVVSALARDPDNEAMTAAYIEVSIFRKHLNDHKVFEL